MRVVTSGLNARFTDQGRVGHQHKGFSQSGALDKNSHCLANALLGKTSNCPTIEVLLGGFTIVATEDIILAVTGAETSIKIDKAAHAINTVLHLLEGQTLEIAPPSLGVRNYIACHKNYDVSYFLGSCNIVAREKSKGLEQSAKGLKAGDIVKYKKPAKTALNNVLKGWNLSGTGLAKELVTKLANEYTLRVVLGYQHELFDYIAKALFFHQRFVVSADMNAMGMRLEGQSIANKSVKMYSEGIANGAIQITPKGLPIIMLCERQTIGGYPKIGSVISYDLPVLGQCRPGTFLRFEPCDMLTARQLWLLQQRRIENYTIKTKADIKAIERKMEND